MQNTLKEKKDNRFRRLGGGHTALLSYHSYRGYFKASICGRFAVFLRFLDGFFQFSLLQPLPAVRPNSARLIKRAFHRIARSIRFQAQREFSIEFEDDARLYHCQCGISSFSLLYHTLGNRKKYPVHLIKVHDLIPLLL